MGTHEAVEVFDQAVSINLLATIIGTRRLEDDDVDCWSNVTSFHMYLHGKLRHITMVVRATLLCNTISIRSGFRSRCGTPNRSDRSFRFESHPGNKGHVQGGAHGTYISDSLYVRPPHHHPGYEAFPQGKAHQYAKRWIGLAWKSAAILSICGITDTGNPRERGGFEQHG